VNAKLHDTIAVTRGTSRALATIETIGSITPIPDADNIEAAQVRGWTVVVRKSEFQPGDKVVYFEIDSHLPETHPAFEFLLPRGNTTNKITGFKGHVLKTIRLRGIYSQGLALPLAQLPELDASLPVGTDVTDLLDVRLYEPPIPAELNGTVRGRIPSWITKTDEDRIQNLREILDARDLEWVATEKVDGSSCTVYRTPATEDEPEQLGVAGRNYDFEPDDKNLMWKMAHKYGLHQLMAQTWPDLRVAIQGEVFGEGVQGNPLKIKGQDFRVFTLQVDGKEIPRRDWPDWLLAISVPKYDLPYPATVEEALAQADELYSLINPERKAEGIVWRANVPELVLNGRPRRASFKVVSNKYLLKHGG